jgi:hypothetical protein
MALAAFDAKGKLVKEDAAGYNDWARPQLCRLPAEPRKASSRPRNRRPSIESAVPPGKCRSNGSTRGSILKLILSQATKGQPPFAARIPQPYVLPKIAELQPLSDGGFIRRSPTPGERA